MLYVCVFHCVCVFLHLVVFLEAWEVVREVPLRLESAVSQRTHLVATGVARCKPSRLRSGFAGHWVARRITLAGA